MCYDPQGREKREVKNHIKEFLDDKDWYFPAQPKINFYFWMPIPKSLSKHYRIHAENEALRHTKKPDVDNLIKFYLDVMTGLIIKDDNCVSIGKAIKVYSKNPRTTIFIEEQPLYVSSHDIYG